MDLKSSVRDSQRKIRREFERLEDDGQNIDDIKRRLPANVY